MKIKIKLLNEDAQMPSRAHDGDAGLDLYSTEYMKLLGTESSWSIGTTGTHRSVGTGIAIEIPHGFVGLVHPRSGLAFKYGVTIVNAPGTIDSGYRGEMRVALINLGYKDYEVLPGDKVAQLVIQRVELPELEIAEELSDHIRGDKGYGSSGR